MGQACMKHVTWFLDMMSQSTQDPRAGAYTSGKAWVLGLWLISYNSDTLKLLKPIISLSLPSYTNSHCNYIIWITQNFHNPLIVYALFIVLVAKYWLQKPSRPCCIAINTCLKSLNLRVMVFPIKTIPHFLHHNYYYYNYSYFTSQGLWILTRKYETIFQIFLSRSMATVKLCFIMQLQDMNHKCPFLYTIDHEAIQSRANAHLQNSLPGKNIVTKTTQQFLKSTCELYMPLWSL